jgi:cytochrome c biogenesis protein CcdA
MVFMLKAPSGAFLLGTARSLSIWPDHFGVLVLVWVWGAASGDDEGAVWLGLWAVGVTLP